MNLDAKTAFAAVQVVGGSAVLGSYAWGIAQHPDTAHLLWGAVPEEWQGPYSACMPPAAVGYLVATWTCWRRLADRELRRLTIAYAVFLAASTAWMPLCFIFLDGGPAFTLLAVRAALLATAASAIAIGAQIATTRPVLPAVTPVGWAFLCWQCVVLDAMVWPWFFPGTPG